MMLRKIAAPNTRAAQAKRLASPRAVVSSTGTRRREGSPGASSPAATPWPNEATATAATNPLPISQMRGGRRPQASNTRRTAAAQSGAVSPTWNVLTSAATALTKRVSARGTKARRRHQRTNTVPASQCNKRRAGQDNAAHAAGDMGVTPPGFDQIAEAAKFPRSRVGHVPPKGELERARGPFEQALGEGGTAAIGNPIAELVGAQRQQPNLLQGRVELATGLGQALAFGRNGGIFLRRAGLGSIAELLQPRIAVGKLRLDRLDPPSDLVAGRSDAV